MTNRGIHYTLVMEDEKMADLPVQGGQTRTWFALLQALGLVLLIILAEYSARHLVGPWLPTIGAWRVNDMLVSAVCYVSLVVLTAPQAKRHLSIFWQELGRIAAQARTPSSWVGVSLLVGTGWLTVADHWLWGRIDLPVWNAPSSTLTLFSQAGPLLRVISLLLVNGLLVPLAEERLWRGLIQPRMVTSMGFVPGLLLTALLFSLKHAIIDASFGRLLTLCAFGLVVGYIAARGSWKQSAFAHGAANTFATVILLFTMGGNV